MLKVWVYIAADTLIGVYATEHLAATKGHIDAVEAFGVTGTFEECVVQKET